MRLLRRCVAVDMWIYKRRGKERWLLRLLPSSYIIRLLLFLVCICAADIVRSLSPRKWVARGAAAFIHVVLQLRIYPLAAGPLFPEAFSITTSCRFFFPFSSIRNSNRFRMFPTCPILFPLCSLSLLLCVNDSTPRTLGCKFHSEHVTLVEGRRERPELEGKEAVSHLVTFDAVMAFGLH